MKKFVICTHHILFGDQIKKNEMGGNVARLGDRIGACRALLGKHEGKNPLGIRRSRWEA
jgi:hypothetical protein